MLLAERQRTAIASRIEIFDVFPSQDSDSDATNDRVFSPIEMSPAKEAQLFQWLTTSKYGSIHKPYASIVNVESLPPSTETESNSLLKSPKHSTVKKSAETTTNSSLKNAYSLCNNCKSRFTRRRTTFTYRITWICASIVILSISLFPWGLLSILFLAIIPTLVRKPICKRCRDTFWSI